MAINTEMPERLNNFKVYNSNNDLLGIVSADLPELESMTETVSGAGIAGEIDTPTLGHYGSMTMSLSWSMITKAAMELAKPIAHEIDLRGAEQLRDKTTGKTVIRSVRLALRAIPKNVTLGSFEVGATTDTEHELEVLYFKLYVDEEEMVEIDKFNFVAKFQGEDVLADVRKAIM